MSRYIGIDPGLLSGAWGVIDHNSRFIACGDIPRDGERINVREFRKILLDNIPIGEHAEIVIEDVFVMPGQGSSSSGKFMRAAGALEAVCYLTATTHIVRPARWKRDMGLTAVKEFSLESARQRWPEADLRLVKHHGRAEALLLSEWLRKELM